MSESTANSNPIGKVLLLVAIAGGGWFFFRNYEIAGLDQVQVHPRSGTDSASADGRDRYFANTAAGTVNPEATTAVLSRDNRMPSTLASNRIRVDEDRQLVPVDSTAGASATGLDRVPPVRVASWALAGFDRNKLAKAHVMDWLARVVRSVDVIALQQITARERDLLPRMIDQINSTGRKYDFVLGPVVGPANQNSPSGQVVLGEQYAFIFDTETLETDRGQLYTVDDPSQQVSYDPLVAWFRTRTVPVERAWTFSIVNFRVDSQRAAIEVPLVANLMAAVAADGRGEDDLLLAGMFQADERQLTHYLGGDACQAAVIATPTDVFQRYQLSNLLSPAKTTTEYLGHGGVIDFPRLFELKVAEAEELSPHLPVFGEFTPSEGI